MATTTTYRQMVNRVLSSCNQPEISAAQWTLAKLEARQAKRIVAECYRDALNQMPDDHWHKEYGFPVYAPVTDGLITDITNDTVTGDGDFQAAVAIFKGYTSWCAAYFRLTSESSWYRIEAFTAGNAATLVSNHLTQGAMAGDGVGYQILAVGYNLPSDFRDIVDVGQPLSGVDMKPTNVPDIRARMAEKSVLLTGADPSWYALGSDDITIAQAVTIKRVLWLWPAPASDKFYYLVYQKLPTLLDYETSDEDETLDLPEDALDRVLYRAKMIGRMEILGDAAGAGLYRSLEKEKQRDDAAKDGSQAGMNKLQPDVGSYRGFYEGARGWGSGRLIRNS